MPEVAQGQDKYSKIFESRQPQNLRVFGLVGAP
jgi:hypothetical protein